MSAGFVLGFVTVIAATFAIGWAIDLARTKAWMRHPPEILGLAAAALGLPLGVLWLMRGNAVAGANMLLGVGGIVTGFGAGTARDTYRGLGNITLGIGATALGTASLVGDEAIRGVGSVWAIGLIAFGLGVVVFGVGVILQHDVMRHASNVVFGAGIAGMGIGVATLAEPGSTYRTALVAVGIGIAVFGVGLVAAAVGLLVGADREPGMAVMAAGAGGILAGTGGIALGLSQLDAGAAVVATGSIVAGVGVIALGIGGIIFGMGGVIDRARLRRIGNLVFAAGGTAFGAGLIAAGVGKAAAELDGLPGGTLLAFSILCAAVGMIVLGCGELFVAHRDLHRPSDTFQLRPDTFHRRGVRIQGPGG